jgi:hypothetical protein
MTVRAINALLYVAAQPDPDELRCALRIPALSPGWRSSMRALLDASASGSTGGGNAGRVPVARPPAWPGFRPLRVVGRHVETADVVSLELDTDDGTPLAHPAPGQFVTVRMQPPNAAVPLVRSYSLSGSPDGAGYRISVKVEPGGAAGTLLRDEIVVGDRLDVAAPRGGRQCPPLLLPTRPRPHSRSLIGTDHSGEPITAQPTLINGFTRPTPTRTLGTPRARTAPARACTSQKYPLTGTKVPALVAQGMVGMPTHARLHRCSSIVYRSRTTNVGPGSVAPPTVAGCPSRASRSERRVRRAST